jgi:hypothetical protein
MVAVVAVAVAELGHVQVQVILDKVAVAVAELVYQAVVREALL